MPKKIDLSQLADLIAEGPAGREKLEKQAQAISELQETLMLTLKAVRPYEIPERSEGNIIQFGVISDLHLGSMYQRTDALRLFYQACAEDGIKQIFCAGDIVDGWRVYRGQEFELRPDGKSWPEQREIFKREVPDVGITTYFITGNHDASFKNLVGLVAGDDFQLARPDWKFIGQEIGEIILKTADGKKFTVQMIHPGGGISAYALSYKPQKIIESISGGQKPDFLIIGHYHKSFFIPAYRNVSGICAGCFQSQTPFMMRQSIAAHIGGWIVTVILGDRKKLTSRVKTEFIGFYEQQRA